MPDINRYITEENRAGVRRLLEKYTDMAEEARDTEDEYIDFIIRILTADASETDMDEGCTEACLEALAEDPDSDGAYAAFINCLRYVKLVYFDKKDGQGYLYPLLQADKSDSAERAFPVYTRKKKALNPAFKSFRSHQAKLSEIADIISASGCEDIIINPDQDGFLFNMEDTVSLVETCAETSGMFRAIFTDGIEGEDLCPLTCACLDSTSVICTLKDGTQISGVLVLPRTEVSEVEAEAVPDADSFTIIKDIEAEDDDKDLEEVLILKADVSAISLAPDYEEDGEEDTEDAAEEGEDLS
ncbi:MAG: hypothetical protein LUD51_05690 [Clostridia bacterium]|nr:hypothetical protein [Clostridia bacterium]